ncbi:MAG: hypothetical protein KJ674_03055 [Nanoarchaeota archaeon]|nr:hypothetical protein [Nanoarchaeota archaeon]
MNKKGDWEDLKKIILVLVFGIILIIFMIYFSGFLAGSGDKAACKNWVNTQASLKVAGIKLADLKSPCITSEETIKDSDKNKIYEQLAGSMYDCWDMYGKGKVDFYSDWVWLGKDKHCMVCSEISIDEKVTKKRPSINIDDFEMYLSNHNPPNHGETYAEFFLNTESSYIDFGEGEIELSSDKPLYSVFFIIKGEAPTMGGEAWEQIKRNTLFAGVTVLTATAISLAFPPIAPFILTTTAGFYTSLGVGLVSANAIEIGEKKYLYPSLLLVSGKEIVNRCGSDININYKKKLFGSSKLKESLGGSE